MRIGMVSPYSLSVPGGVQGQVLGLARALRTKGHFVQVLGPCDGPPPEPGITPLGNSIPTAANGSIAPIAPDVSAQLRFIRSLRDEDFDVLHLHEPISPGPNTTAAIMKHAPLVGTFHAAGNSKAYEYLGFLARWVNRRLDVRCAVSEDARALAQRHLGGDYTILFNGIEIERFARAEPEQTDAPTVFFLGRHEERKGLQVLLAALRFLPADLRVWVAGDGPLTASLRERYRGDPRIEWLGLISDVDRARRLRGADVYCAPSIRGESFGIVLLEAMAAGVPIVAANLDGYANVARADVEAVLVEPGSPEALAAGILQVLGDPPLAASLVAAGSRRAEAFSMEHLADRYLELYQPLIR
jgi:phosphatidylinositol alpha-mannosyltransferase